MSIELPFSLVDNRVFLRVRVNGQGPLEFVLDTGAGDGSSVSMTTFRRLGLPNEGSDYVTGAGAAKAQVVKSHANSLRVGTTELGPVPLMAIPLQDMINAIGFEKFDGILGDALFNRFVVTIDFNRNRINLDDPEAYRPPAGAIIVPITSYNHLVPMYDGAVDGIPGKFLIDLGDRSSLTLFRPFWSAHGLNKTGVLAMTGIGIGGPIRGVVTRVGALTLGTVQVTQPVTRLVLQKPSAIDDHVIAGSVGTGILKRFQVTFDYRHGRMILMPGASAGRPDLYDRAGIWLGRAGHELKVLDVTPGGPAEAAGIKPGDVVVSVDGTAAADVNLPALRDRLTMLSVGSVALGVDEAGHRSVRRLVLRDLIPPAH
ncbi:MAG: aspartyl protease family protein [Chthoniobacterales bacterium]|nr:aspartyl protease family protein [Chthoniobacterales bacterium]